MNKHPVEVSAWERSLHRRREQVLQTDDLFLGAFGLIRGGELAEIEVRGTNGRKVAVFRIEGRGVEDAERDYYRGAATVDLRLLKSEVRRLEDAGLRGDSRRGEEERCRLPKRVSSGSKRRTNWPRSSLSERSRSSARGGTWWPPVPSTKRRKRPSPSRRGRGSITASAVALPAT